MADALVEPRAGAEVPAQVEPSAPAPQAAAPAAPQAKAGIPDEILQIPAMQALFSGAPPAVSAPIKEFMATPIAKTISQNADSLMKAGIGFYSSLSGDLGVIFNQFYIHPEDLKNADKAGKLLQLAPPFDSVDHEIAKSGKNNPVLSAQGVPNGPKAPSPMAPPQSAASVPQTPTVAPASNGIQKQIMGVRAKNVAQQPPTGGPAPGGGQILNQILRPVV